MNSFISWVGGKKLLRNKILEQFPKAGSFDRYIEVFGGAGWVLFSKEKHAKMEVFNDINSQLINLYRCVKYHDKELQRELDYILMSREQFFDCKAQVDIQGLTDIQRAAKFYIIIKESFGSGLDSFGVKQRNIISAREYLTEVSKRLNRVVIENRDFEHLIKTYDRESALFYLDPPYYDAEKYYPDRFDVEDHARLREILGKIKGKFLLSYNDRVEIRELYKGFNIIEVSRHDNIVTKTESRKYKELIIKNY